VAHEREHHRRLVADPVDHQAEEDDADGERPEADAEDLALLRLREAELCAPLVDDQGPHDEPERGRDQGNEAAPEQELVAARGGAGGGPVVRHCAAAGLGQISHVISSASGLELNRKGGCRRHHGQT
jgi:hypothetical protein